MAVVVKGIESIRVVEKYAAPVLIILCVSLFVWAYIAVSFFLFLHGRFD
jgi:cytosine/uracil/thiamine/allantoin permease